MPNLPALRLRAWLPLLLTLLLAPCLPVQAAQPAPVIRVSGNHLVDASGNTVQLRGVNLSGLEFTAIQGWSPANPWGSVTIDFDRILAWKANAVRIPLNEASWLGTTCVDASGKQRRADPGGNYRETVAQAVKDATRAGLYVILDLHWTAPGQYCPLAQAPLADIDNSPAFWTQLARAYKDQPNVLFELFNEPFMDWLEAGQDPWRVLRDGGTFSQLATGLDNPTQLQLTWRGAGMQQLLDTVRATGATNVVLAGAPVWDKDIGRWLEFRPSDPLKQLAAVWHAYPRAEKPGSADAAVPGFGAEDYQRAESILAAGIPLIITETGDRAVAGTRGAELVSKLLPWADQHGVSYLGWAWAAWQHPYYVLLKDYDGRPSDGYGEYFRQHLTCVAAGKSPCP